YKRQQLKNPVAILDKDFTYTLLATTSGGCKAEDKINIKISLSSQIYVPNAFTPNGDGNNDIIKPGLVGIRELKYYAIYNRYGQLVFKTASKNEGWDGLINGKPQHTGSYVWVAEGIDYTGKTIFRKGTTILIK
ncbi:MAG: T9SS type B sorting domain-containing protein, partial [Ferruginibacter sp.]